MTSSQPEPPSSHPAQPHQQRIATEPEPRVLCGLPIGGAVGILGSILMICQIFGLYFVSPNILYFFEVSIGCAMMFVLSTGVKNRKIAYVTAYMLYVSMYTFWVFFLILGAVLTVIYLADAENICPSKDQHEATTPKGCVPKLTTGEIEVVAISCFFLTISIVVAILQMKYLMVLYNHLRRNMHRLPAHHAHDYNVQYFVPTPLSPSGMPPPPRYTAHAAPTHVAPPSTTTKQPLDNEPTPAGSRNGSVVFVATPILSATNASGSDNLAFGDEDLSDRGRAPSRPPAYSDVIEPGHITVRADALS